MNRFAAFRIGTAVAVAILLIAEDARAWGAKSSQSIAIAAIRLTRDQYPEAFGSAATNFERDVLRGIVDGTNRMRSWYPLHNEAEALSALDSEIQLLRRAKEYGFDSYFSYRMGVVGGLAADLCIPGAIAYKPEDQATIDRMNGDIDLHIDELLFRPAGSRAYIRSAAEYFGKRRVNFDGLGDMVRVDYRTGSGYQGTLKNGVKVFYNNSIESVSDVWFTILRHTDDSSDIRPSNEALTGYMVMRIEYILNIKHNTADMERAYKEFREMNPGTLESWEAVGDVLYNYGPETRDRGVREWERALELPGRNRLRVVKKLGNHYLTVGEELLQQASAEPKGRDENLKAAKDSFADTLKYDRTNDRAAKLLTQTNNDIREREANRSTQISIIAGAEKVMQQASEMKKVENFQGAIQAYTQAKGLLAAVSSDFPEQLEASNKRIGEIGKALTDINSGVIQKAGEMIEQGRREVEAKKFDDAITMYRKIPDIVSVIPQAEKNYYDSAQKLISDAQEKEREAERERIRWDEQQKMQQATPAPKGAKPAGAKK
jgi:tetratricopeptide (TPR) repeat protein